MPVYASAGNYTPAPEGVHQGICVDVIALGVLETKFGKKPCVRLVWEIDETRDNGKRFLVKKQYPLTVHEKSALKPHVEVLIGRKITKEEAKNFDVETAIGGNCLLSVTHSDDGQWANVDSVMPIKKGMQKMYPSGDYTRKPAPEPPPAQEEPAPADEDVPF